MRHVCGRQLSCGLTFLVHAVSDAFERLVRGERVPFGAPARAALAVAERAYAAVIAARNARFERQPDRVVHVGVPVISVGNLTTGGTGKTPLVIDLTKRLQARGRRVGVISRGYRSARGHRSDEERLVRRHCPNVITMARPKRIVAARVVVDGQRCDCVIADDAFQHRQLGRDLDIVVIDALRPFGHGHLLPRGLLREPIESLHRADLVVISRADQVKAPELAAIAARVQRVRPDLPIIRARHRPGGFWSLDGSEPRDVPAGARGLCFAGIGNPAAFVATLQSLGIEPQRSMWWPDHHAYTWRNVGRVLLTAFSNRAEWVLTTEKDAVKLAVFPTDWPIPAAALRIEIEFLDDGEAVLERILTDCLSQTCAAVTPDAMHDMLCTFRSQLHQAASEVWEQAALDAIADKHGERRDDPP